MAARRGARARSAPVVRETGSADFAFEVQFLLDAPAPAVDDAEVDAGRRSATRWSSSVPARWAPSTPRRPVPTWNVHVHVNDVGAAIEAGVGPAARTGSR